VVFDMDHLTRFCEMQVTNSTRPANIQSACKRA